MEKTKSNSCEYGTFGHLKGGLQGHLDRAFGGEAPPIYVILLAMYASCNSFNFGFDGGSMAGILVLVQEDMQLSDLKVGIYMGIINLGACIGSLLSYKLNDNYGRRYAFAASQVVLVVGGLVQISSRGFAQLAAGRLIGGLGMGIGFAVDPLYIAEVAPAAHRGKLVSWSEIAINMGLMCGFMGNWLLLDLPVGYGWRAMVLCGLVLPTILLGLCITVMPETPRWLVRKGQHDIAVEVLRRTHHEGVDVVPVADEIHREVEAERGMRRPSFFEMDPHKRWGIILALGVATAQQLTGNDSVVGFGPRIFQDVGAAESRSQLFLFVILVGMVKAAVVVVATFFIDEAGRRPLLITSTLGCCFSLAMLSMGSFAQSPLIVVSGACFFMAAFSFGIGPVTWLLAAELTSLDVRATAMGMCTFFNRFTAGFVAFTFLPLVGWMGQGWYFALFAMAAGLMALVAIFCIPETKQSTLEELSMGMGRSKASC